MMTTPLANIGPRGCRRRGTMGWVWLALGAGYVALLVARDAPVGWYAAAVIPFLLGALGYFQARERTCVFLAVVGQRNLDDGARRIDDTAELARVRREARGVWLRALGSALLLTLLAIVVGSVAS